MNPRDDLCEVNAALLELVRLQLAGELDAATAWHTPVSYTHLTLPTICSV